MGGAASRPAHIALILIVASSASACVGSSAREAGSASSRIDAVGTSSSPRSADDDLPPNVVVVVTDDQTVASMRGKPVAMPWLHDQLARPGWTTFRNAVASTPLCCPSRASMLTGRYARRTGVQTNGDGASFDASDTIAVRLRDAGYRTALVGKYLNGFPWGGPAAVPPGWDRFFAKLNASLSTTYYGYDVVDDGRRFTVGTGGEDYATDRLAAEAVAFVEDAPRDRPFFLWFAPSAPHDPAEPAPRHVSLLEAPVDGPDASERAAMNDVTGAPAWVRALPPIDRARAVRLARARLRERIALRAVDDAVRKLWDAVGRRGERERTVWLFLSDNGYSFGDRRWVGKTCPWETCVRIPFVAHVPGTEGGPSDALVANVDVAPTVADLAGVELGDVDGRSLAGVVRDGETWRRRAVLLEWIGDREVPGWVGVRFRDAVFVRHADGTRELYDLAADPRQRTNLVGDPEARRLESRAEHALDRLLAAVGPGG